LMSNIITPEAFVAELDAAAEKAAK
jgi:hypothetical protein